MQKTPNPGKWEGYEYFFVWALESKTRAISAEESYDMDSVHPNTCSRYQVNSYPADFAGDILVLMP